MRIEVARMTVVNCVAYFAPLRTSIAYVVAQYLFKRPSFRNLRIAVLRSSDVFLNIVPLKLCRVLVDQSVAALSR
jgi:hypothetical protein